MDTVEYFGTEETTRRRELAYGILREPPAPFFSHQAVVLRVARLLADYVEPRGLGVIAVAPVDVVLDSDRALIVQPDVLYVSAARQSIIRNQVWGAPDLVVEVLSIGTERHDWGEKLDWYRMYGVREYWLVDPVAMEIVTFDFTGAHAVEHRFTSDDPIRSTVLPDLALAASAVLG